MSTEDTGAAPNAEQPSQADEQPSVRDSLSAAFEKHEAIETAAAPGAAAAPTAPQSGAAPQAPAPAPSAAARPALGGGAAVPAAPALEALKAPASWKADLRERWNTLPRDVQAEVIRRESEHGEKMRDYAEMRQFAENFYRISEPYRGLMEAEGANPIAAYQDYLRTSALLRTGAPAQKAQAIAQLVQQFAIPLDALDAYLAAAIRGQPAPQMQGQQHAQQQPHQFRDPRLDALLANIEERDAASRREELASFANDPKHEFFADVRLTMADLMDAGAKRGIRLSLDEAYARACLLEPEVKKVLDSRGATSTVTRAAQTLAAARHAASGLPNQPAAPAHRSNGSLPANPSVRQSLEAAWDNVAAQS